MNNINLSSLLARDKFTSVGASCCASLMNTKILAHFYSSLIVVVFFLPVCIFWSQRKRRSLACWFYVICNINTDISSHSLANKGKCTERPAAEFIGFPPPPILCLTVTMPFQVWLQRSFAFHMHT